MGRLARHDTAPWVHSLLLGGIVIAALSWPIVRHWLMAQNPEVMAGLIIAVSRTAGALLKRAPAFQSPERKLTVTTQRVHDRIETVIDTLAVIQAELDTAAEQVTRTRAEAQHLDREGSQ